MAASASRQGEQLADKFREEHALGVEPINRIDSLMDMIDIDFVVIEMPEDLEAITLQDPDTGKKLVGISTTKSPYRQRFSVAHEVGHIVANDVSESASVYECTAYSESETRAHSFARHLLCPLKGVEKVLKDMDPASLKALSTVVRTFQVSPGVALIQMKNAKLISESDYEELSGNSAPALATRFGWKEEYDFESSISAQEHHSHSLSADATQAYLEGKVSIEAVALSRGISSQQALAEMEELEKEQKSRLPDRDPLAEIEDFFSDF